MEGLHLALVRCSRTGRGAKNVYVCIFTCAQGAFCMACCDGWNDLEHPAVLRREDGMEAQRRREGGIKNKRGRKGERRGRSEQTSDQTRCLSTAQH
eukprot:350027-Chlamydomonas_euryale.AAC.6